MGRGRTPVGVVIRPWALLGLCLCFFSAGSLAFALGSTVGSVDLDTTLPLTTAAFWQFAHSQDFYRSTRQQSTTVRQEVVDLSDWQQAEGPTDSKKTAQPLAPSAAATGSPRPGGRIFRRPALSEDRQQPQPQQQPQQPQSRRPRPWHRKARLNYAISSPFGASDATVVQEHTLLELEQQEAGGGGGGGGGAAGTLPGVCYSERDCITGFPMIPGDLSVKTTFLVTPADGDPERVRVRVGVVVEEIELPRRLKFLSKRVSKIIGNGGRKQAEKWLAEMITAGSLAAPAAVEA